jgi:threonylcarbamoyladenosine tRNA methylthiotransferase MtaB
MNIYLDSIGCRLNQSEIETFARQFRSEGHNLVDTPSTADITIINTCTVTAAADSDSRQKIRQIVRTGAKGIIVTGCWSSLHKDEALAIPGVNRVIHNFQKENLVPKILNIPKDQFDIEPIARLPIPGGRFRTRASIKVQDGCNNRCTFCITSIARGPSRSRQEKEILSDIYGVLKGNADGDAVKEVVLTGVHLGSWGQDLAPKQHLHQLVRSILRETDIPRLRLSSLEPWDINEDFFSLWEDSRLCRQIHLPLQSGSEVTLHRMARKISPDEYAHLVSIARKNCPDIAITTDVITGFPGESIEEFDTSIEFVRRMKFAGGHVFTYSERPGTAAAEMPDQVFHPIRKTRNARMRAVLAESAQEYRTRFLHQTLPVLWECAVEIEPQGWQHKGLTDNYIRINAFCQQNYKNQITPVRMTKLNKDGLHGEITLT